MSERLFTRLKQHLSEHGTAAKTRETVSRGLRQSLNINNESIFMFSCIGEEYENNVRQWENELKQCSQEFAQCFLVDETVDIQVPFYSMM